MLTLTKISLAITIGLQLCVLALLVRRRLQRRFPWFLTYTSNALVASFVLFLVADNQQAYFEIYWLREVLAVGLTVASLRESFLGIFWPETRQRWFKWIFWTCIGLDIGYASLKAWLSPPQQAGPLVSVIIGFEIGLQYLIAGIGILYFGLIKLLKVMEHQLESGIILGFGMNASLVAFAVLIRSTFGARFALFAAWLPAVAYILAEATWLATLLKPERKLPEPEMTLEQMNEALDSYMEMAKKYLGKE